MAGKYYEDLGVDENATSKQIKNAYRRLARRYHPDTPETGDADKFHAVNKAYRILMDEYTRSIYDATGNEDDDDFRPPEELWLKILIESFDNAVYELGTKLDEANIIEVMKESMFQSAASLQKSVEDSTGKRDALIRLRKRLQRREHTRPNVFLTSLDRQIQARSKEITHNGRAVRIMHLCLEELSYYRSPLDIMFSFGMPRGPEMETRINYLEYLK